MKQVFKTKIAMLLSVILCLSSLFGVLSFAANADQNENSQSGSSESALIIDKTATPLDQLGQTNVTLSVPGTIEADIDIVLLLGGGMQANKETVYSAINLFKPLMESGKSTVKLGLISLERGEEIIVDLADDEAVLDPETYEQFIEEKFEYISSLPVGSTNLHSQLVEAKRMLDADTEVDADNKYLFVIATGRTYYFDDVNGNQATIVNKTTVKGTDYYYYGNYLWQSQRGGHTSLYMIPARYNNNWDAYWADVCKWVEADGDKYVYTLPIDKNDNASFETWSTNNNKDIKELTGGSSRFGWGIVNPVPTAADFVTGEMNAIGDGSNPQHALNYERAQYEAAKAYQALVDEGYNCYAICSETAYYQNNSAYIANRNYTGSSTMQLGHSFMNYLASLSGQEEAPTVWDFARDDEGNPILFYEDEVLQEDFFTPIEEDILYTCSIGSTVEDYIGYDPEIGNFEFITDPATITLTVSGNPYFTTQVETKEGFTASYAFSKEEGGEPTFWLDYDHGNGTTTEKFIWTFGENVSLTNKASLTYKLQLTDTAKVAGVYVIDTNLSATLYPKDSDGNDREPIPFPVPNVEYTVDPANVSLEGIKYLDNEAASGFEFQLILSDGTVLETVVSDEDGKFVFETLVFEQEGTYRYTVKEVLGTDDMVLYDEAVYAVTVEVKVEDGDLQAVVSLQKDDQDYEGQIEFYNESLTPITDEDIPEASVPKTGDNFNAAFAVMLVSGALLVAGVAFTKKRRSCQN